MNYADWYTDTMQIWRNVATTTNGLTSYDRQMIAENVPCRIYQSDNQPISMEQTSAHIKQNDRLMCGINTDIRAGDQLIIERGGGLGYSPATIRAFAADPNYYYEPFGAVMPGLAHIEVRLLQEERV
ncbi:MAG: hypothetical protein Q3W84_04875 [Eubacteriales bacterium]|nr:hypothetical protein [Eubacteriales bacterium]